MSKGEKDLIYPLKSQIPELEPPHSYFGWDDEKGVPITEQDEEKTIGILLDIQGEENLFTHWSVVGIDQRYLNEPIPFKIGMLNIKEFGVIFPDNMSGPDGEPLTWMDIWKLIDGTLRALGYDSYDPVFIEGFSRSGDDYDIYTVLFGS